MEPQLAVDLTKTVSGFVVSANITQMGTMADHHADWEHPAAANTYLADGNTGRFIALLSTLVLSAFPFSFAPELLVATVCYFAQFTCHAC